MDSDSPITRLKEGGLDYGVQATLLGVNPTSLRRWEDGNNMPEHYHMLAVAFADAVESDDEVATEVKRLIYSRGVLHALHYVLSVAVSTLDT